MIFIFLIENQMDMTFNQGYEANFGYGGWSVACPFRGSRLQLYPGSGFALDAPCHDIPALM